MSQADLAAALATRRIPGMHPQTITKIENGQRALKFTEAVAIAGVMGTDLANLDVYERTDAEGWLLQQATQETIRAAREVKRAIIELLELQGGLAHDIESGQRADANPVVIALAQSVADVSLAGIVAEAEAVVAANAVRDAATDAARNPEWSLESLESRLEEEMRRRSDGEHQETP